jgi:hypothetical protein
MLTVIDKEIITLSYIAKRLEKKNTLVKSNLLPSKEMMQINNI